MNKINSSEPLDPARKLAADALLQIWRGESVLSHALFDSAHHEINARAYRLTRETLRHENGFAKLVAKHSKNTPKPAVRAIIYIACFEMLVEFSADYGVVHDFVSLTTSQHSTKNAAGFVNALLRKISTEKYRSDKSSSFSPEVHQALRAQYDKKHIADMSNGQFIVPDIDVCLKPDLHVETWADKLDATIIDPIGVLRLPARSMLSELEGFEDGQWWVQDAAATIAAKCFDDLNGKRALDLCAAPGGKTMQMISLGADVTAVELNEDRAEQIWQNLERTKMQAEVHVCDALEFEDEPFDCILVDAPCSASGTFRRHPDLKHANVIERAQELAPIQAGILRHAFSLLKTGGELVYATCSLLKEEGEQQIESFLSDTHNAKITSLNAEKFGLSSEYAPFLRSFPSAKADQVNMDGFFIAKITKNE